MIKISLTDEQREALEPLFNRMREANRAGLVGAIAAQVWPDGIVAVFLPGKKATALSVALGADLTEVSDSATERMAHARKEWKERPK